MLLTSDICEITFTIYGPHQYTGDDSMNSTVQVRKNGRELGPFDCTKLNHPVPT